MLFTYGKHPNAHLTSSVFKWAVFRKGELFEGFIHLEDAYNAAKEYNRQNMRCDQCVIMMIQGVPCHEVGCPNMKKVWDEEEQKWVRDGEEEEDDECDY